MKKFKLSDERKTLIVAKAKELSKILQAEPPKTAGIFSAVIDFVFIFEQIILYKLAESDLLLIYEKIPSPTVLKLIVALEAVDNVHTVDISTAFIRYKALFPKSVITKHSKEIELICDYRNELQHQIVAFKKVSENDLLQLIRGAYSSIKSELESIVGKLPTSKQTTFTSERIATLFKDSVKKKLRSRGPALMDIMVNPIGATNIYAGKNILDGSYVGIEPYLSPNESCPACGFFSFSRKQNMAQVFLASNDNLIENYMCSNCGLELSPEEYEVAKEIIKEKRAY